MVCRVVNTTQHDRLVRKMRLIKAGKCMKENLAEWVMAYILCQTIAGKVRGKSGEGWERSLASVFFLVYISLQYFKIKSDAFLDIVAWCIKF